MNNLVLGAVSATAVFVIFRTVFDESLALKMKIDNSVAQHIEDPRTSKKDPLDNLLAKHQHLKRSRVPNPRIAANRGTFTDVRSIAEIVRER